MCKDKYVDLIAPPAIRSTYVFVLFCSICVVVCGAIMYVWPDRVAIMCARSVFLQYIAVLLLRMAPKKRHREGPNDIIFVCYICSEYIETEEARAIHEIRYGVKSLRQRFALHAGQCEEEFNKIREAKRIELLAESKKKPR